MTATLLAALSVTGSVPIRRRLRCFTHAKQQFSEDIGDNCRTSAQGFAGGGRLGLVVAEGGAW